MKKFKCTLETELFNSEKEVGKISFDATIEIDEEYVDDDMESREIGLNNPTFYLKNVQEIK